MKPESNNIVHYPLGAIPPNIIMAGMLFQMVGLAFLLLTSWVSILFFVTGLLIFSIKDYLAVDYDKNQLMKYMKILNYRLGKWESMENARYIALVKIKTHRKQNLLTIGSQTSSIDVKANMVFGRRQYLTLFKLKKGKAMPIVEDIASRLNIDIHDLTMRKKYRLTPRTIKTTSIDNQ